jgi:lipopolysaccharide/colanic/teichoic acid biosynthesis glycosyltransferase
MDVAGAIIGLAIAAPLFVLVAIAVRVTSDGPVFFSQIRVGRGGATFRIFKFRSMVTDAEQKRKHLEGLSVYSDQRLFKIPKDPRVTRVGRVLRRTSLDELPQLVNVLLGDMSLVGPRPPLPSEVALYEEHHYSRFEMRPGITGPWQTSGRNEISDFDSVVQLEQEYLRYWSIWRDCAILLKTVPTVLKMRGAH